MGWVGIGNITEMVCAAITGVYKSSLFLLILLGVGAANKSLYILVFQKSNQRVDLCAGFEIAHEIPSLSKEVQEWVHCAWWGKMWGEVVPCVPFLRNRDSPGQSRVEERMGSAKVPFIFLFYYSFMICDFLEFFPC